MNKEVIYEDKFVKVETTGHGYDFIATIQNKINFALDCYIGHDEDRICMLEADGWVGILANDEGYEELELIKEKGIGY